MRKDPNNPGGYVTQAKLNQQFADEKQAERFVSVQESAEEFRNWSFTGVYKGKCPFCGAEIKEGCMSTNITATFEFNGQFTCDKCQQFVIVGVFGSKEEALQNVRLAVRLFDQRQVG